MILLMRSTPFSTPSRMIPIVSAAKSRNHPSTPPAEPRKVEKYASCASSIVPPRRYSKRYLHTQPPMTQ